MGLYFKNFPHKIYKIGLINSSLSFHRQCFSLYSNFIKFYHEVDTLKSILYKNNCQLDLIDKCINEFLEKLLAPKTKVSAVPKKDLVIALPSLCKFCLQIRTRINHVMKSKL